MRSSVKLHWVRIIVCISTITLLSKSLQAQKQTIHQNQVWLGYFNQSRFSKHWGSWVDLHLRTKENFFDSLNQTILRFGGTYYLSDNVKFTAGYAYVTNYPQDNHAYVSRQEHRIWQQFQWYSNYPRLRLMQWIRLEERFRQQIKNAHEIGNGYNFNYRLRYSIRLMLPLASEPFAPGSFSAVFNDELFINFGKEIVYNYFDQNRFFAGFAYHLNKRDVIQFGYMNLFQQMPSGNQYKSINAARIYYLQNLDFRKK
jgi:Protein of unknown function (DUF2490)